MRPSKITFGVLALCATGAFMVVSYRRSEVRLARAATSVIPVRSHQLASSQPALPTRTLESSVRDPFAVTVNAPQAALAAASKPTEPPPLAIPTAPPLNIRFEGRMTSPSGEQLVFASDGVTSTALTIGQAFSNGYIVKSIDDKAVEFEYPPLGTTTRIDLPPEPRQEIR